MFSWPNLISKAQAERKHYPKTFPPSSATPEPYKMDRDPWTLTRFILSEQQKHENATGDLTLVLASISTACKSISSAVRRAGLLGIYGAEGTTNSTGDSVKKLDIISDDIFCNSLRHTKRVALMVSEEQEEPIVVQGAESGKYIVAFE